VHLRQTNSLGFSGNAIIALDTKEESEVRAKMKEVKVGINVAAPIMLRTGLFVWIRAGETRTHDKSYAHD
jgi:hypothetical protein